MSMFDQPPTPMPRGGPQFPKMQPQWSNQISLANAQRAGNEGNNIKGNILQFAQGQTPGAASGAATPVGVQQAMGKMAKFSQTEVPDEVTKNLRMLKVSDSKTGESLSKAAAKPVDHAKIARWAADSIVKCAMGVPQTGYPQPGAAPMPPQGPPVGAPVNPGASQGPTSAQPPQTGPMPAQGPGGAMMPPPGPPMVDPSMMGAATPPADPSLAPVPTENAQLAPDDLTVNMPVLTGMSADPDALEPQVDEAMKYDKMVTASLRPFVKTTFEKTAASDLGLSLGVTGAHAGAGALLGAGIGAAFPDKDKDGKKKSRLRSALQHALFGGVTGGALGASRVWRDPTLNPLDDMYNRVINKKASNCRVKGSAPKVKTTFDAPGRLRKVVKSKEKAAEIPKTPAGPPVQAPPSSNLNPIDRWKGNNRNFGFNSAQPSPSSNLNPTGTIRSMTTKSGDTPLQKLAKLAAAMQKQASPEQGNVLSNLADMSPLHAIDRWEDSNPNLGFNSAMTGVGAGLGGAAGGLAGLLSPQEDDGRQIDERLAARLRKALMYGGVGAAAGGLAGYGGARALDAYG